MNRNILNDDHSFDSYSNGYSKRKRPKEETENSVENKSTPTNSHESVNPEINFLFRSTVLPKGDDEVFNEAERNIKSIYEAISKGGFDAFQKLKYAKKENKVSESIQRKQERLASLQDAVVKGDPRRYQLALFELAKTNNTIVHLGTGHGKTLIALLLIRHFSYMFEQGKQTILLAPSVALAIQHTTTIQANLPYTVATANHNSIRNERVRDSFAKANILVATHGALKHLLMHYGDLFSMKRVNLLIVDECHYTHGNHGYAHIMKDFYHCVAEDDRPRVLGLTASPLMNVRSDASEDELALKLENLEKLMDSAIVDLSDLFDDDGVASSFEDKESEERIIHYQSESSFFPPFPKHDDIGLHTPRIKEFNQLFELYRDLGPKACSIYSSTLARELSHNKYGGETLEQYHIAIGHLIFLSNFFDETSLRCSNGGRTEKLALLEQFLEDSIEKQSSIDTVGIVFVERRITALALHDYFRTRLKSIPVGSWHRVERSSYYRIKNVHFPRQSSSGMAMVISEEILNGADTLEVKKLTNLTRDQVEDAIISSVLQDYVPKNLTMKQIVCAGVQSQSFSGLEKRNSSTNASLLENGCSIKTDIAVRQCTQIFRYLDQTTRQGESCDDRNWLHKSIHMEEVLNRLRAKQTNVLLATSVVEEGVDVAACSFVVAFDHMRSIKGYVQMKGRARRKNAKFIVFQDVAPDSRSQYIDLRAAQSTNARIKACLQSRKRSSSIWLGRELNDLPSQENQSDLEMVALQHGEYRTRYALVNMSSAKDLFFRFVLSIPNSNRFSCAQGSLSYTPHFEGDTLILPSHIPSSMRFIKLPCKYNNCGRKEKQDILAFIACVRLHKLGLLNDRLLPLKKVDIEDKLIFNLTNSGNVTVSALEKALISPTELSPTTMSAAMKSSSDLEIEMMHFYRVNQNGIHFDRFKEVLGCKDFSLCLMSNTTLPDISIKEAFEFIHVELGDVTVGIQKIKSLAIDKASSSWDICTEFYATLINARWRKKNQHQLYVYSSDSGTHGIVPSYVIGCITTDGDLDYTLMRRTIDEFKRSEKERIDAVRKSSTHYDLERPRLWIPIHEPNLTYVSYRPSGLNCSAAYPEQSNGIETYRDYFASKWAFPISLSSELFSCKKLWSLSRSFQHLRCRSKSSRFSAQGSFLDVQSQNCDVFISVDACMEAPVANAGLFLLCTFLPQILYLIDMKITSHAFVTHCSAKFPILGGLLHQITVSSMDDLVDALTAKSCALKTSYDRLEWLGDAVLKLIHTDSLLSLSNLQSWVRSLHEGGLSKLRSLLGSNKRLRSVCIRVGFDRFILFRQLSGNDWAPVGLKFLDFYDQEDLRTKCVNRKPGNKVFADVIESLLGLIYVKCGFLAAYDVAIEIGVTIPRDSRDLSCATSEFVQSALADAFSTILGGYHFQQPVLLEEALTHPSCLHEHVSSYQRLEWVGDAVLSLFARDWIHNQYPNLSVGELVPLEATLVCNESLAHICCLHKLQVHMNHADSTLPGKIEKFERIIKLNGFQLWTTDPPKVLSDIVESIIGAVYMDAGFLESMIVIRNLMKPIIDCLPKTLSADECNEMRLMVRKLMHPRQRVHEVLGSLVNIKIFRTDLFLDLESLRYCPIWNGHFWGKISDQGASYIGLVESYGIGLFGVQDRSSSVAQNRACDIILELIENRPETLRILKELPTVIQKDNYQQ